jgi:hypothetical protein
MVLALKNDAVRERPPSGVDSSLGDEALSYLLV